MGPSLALDDDTYLLCLTGAGVSAESGLPTFRDANGLWENQPVEEVASPEGFARDPRRVWRFYSQRREAAARCQPNPGHHALASAEQRLLERFLLVTQNVDGLHHRARSERLVELHGNLFTSRCSLCDRPPFPDERLYFDQVPRCVRCQGPVRPHIVWFGEDLLPGDWARALAFIERGRKHRLVFVAAGTSGTVYPAAGLVQSVREARGETWLVNAEASQNVRAFQHYLRGRSGEILPELLR
jgi:NAD-dependent deacetylase